MSYCPLISYQKQCCSSVDCMGEDCAFWSHNRDTCLIRLSLLKYSHDVFNQVSKKDELEAKINILQKQVQAASMGFPIVNFDMGLNTAKHPPDKPIGGDTIEPVEEPLIWTQKKGEWYSNDH